MVDYERHLRSAAWREIRRRALAAADYRCLLCPATAELEAFIGGEPHTPLDNAVRTSLAALGCLCERTPSRDGRRDPSTLRHGAAAP